MTKIEAIWQSLEKEVEQKNDNGVIRKLFSSDTSFYVSLGVCSDTMKHLVAFEINDSNITNYKSLPRVKGIEVNKLHFGDERDGLISLVLSVSNRIYNRSFDILCEDLIEYVYKSSEKQLISMLAERLGIWKKFFSENPCEILTEEKQIGLVGELRLINILFDNDIDKSLILNSWKGYDHSSQDFIFRNSICIEAKASKSPKNVKISSEYQLDESDHEKCFMYFCHVSFTDESDWSLNQLVDHIREKLINYPNVSKTFEDGLFQYGYFDIHRDFYTRQLKFIKEVFFQITDGFPRIKRSDLREKVNSVKYMIDMTNLEEYEISDSDVKTIISCEG